MLQVAVEKQKILTNPCDRVDPPRVPKREMTFLDWDQAVRLADAHGDRYRPLIYVAVDCGMRWSELVGLRRGSVDLHRRKIRVIEQLVQLDSREYVRREPKTAAGMMAAERPPSGAADFSRWWTLFR
jgi:integrase